MKKLLKLIIKKKYNCLINVISISIAIITFILKKESSFFKYLGISQGIIIVTLNILIIFGKSIKDILCCCKKQSQLKNPTIKLKKLIKKGNSLLISIKKENELLKQLSKEKNNEAIALYKQIKFQESIRRKFYKYK